MSNEAKAPQLPPSHRVTLTKPEWTFHGCDGSTLQMPQNIPTSVHCPGCKAEFVLDGMGFSRRKPPEPATPASTTTEQQEKSR